MWKPYQERTNRRPDFRVRYRFIPTSEGGRVQLPSQGYRSDLHYEGEDTQKDGLYMIWPEFLDEGGSIILDEGVSVPAMGEAFMWILCYEEMSEYHRERAFPGRQCWFMEGQRKVAEATIVEQIGLATP